MTLPSNEEINSQLERILTSADFCAQPRQKAFLKFVVEQTLAGNSHEIKAYTLATKVFGRGPNFDQNNNPIVSIHAAKLRNALELYYLKVGKNDSVRINIPKGAYVPVFEKIVFENPSIGDEDQDAPETLGISWPCVCVHPFHDLTNDPDLEYWSIGLATELATELSRFPDVRVLVRNPNNRILPSKREGCRFELQGSFHSYKKSIKVVANLTDNETDTHLWTDTHRFPLDAIELSSYQEDVARVVSAKIAGEFGVIARAVLPKLSNATPRQLTSYEACLQFYEYNASLTHDSFLRALRALENAVMTEPECGQTWSMLGRLYGNIHSLDYPGFENPLEKAYEYANKGVLLAPDDQRCRATRAYIHLFRDDRGAGLIDAEQALTLRSNSLFMLDGIGYVMTLLGNWERGTNLIHEVIQLNPFYNNVVHYALWVNWLRQENYSQAYLETQHLNRPALFWDHLAIAASLGLLDRIEEGQKSLSKLLQLKPEFSECGRRLIRHYIKFDEIVERVIAGLGRLGLEVH